MPRRTPLKKDVENKVREELIETKKLKYCFECGICTATCPVVQLLPDHYNPRVLLEETFLNLDETLSEKGIWLCAWCYKCYRRCPQRTKVPEVLGLVKDLAAEHGRLQSFKSALELIKSEVPLPTVCCYACFHPERGEVEKPLIREALKRLLEEYERAEKRSAVSRLEKHGKKVAIIGSGPAGLTAAQELVKRSYSVTVFEHLPAPGGMLRVGLPEHRMPKSVLDTEIRRLENLGVEIKTNVTVGRDVTIDELLRQGYKAVFIAVGAHKSQRLRLEGEDLKGVVDALDFLRRVNTGEKVELGERVAVIGGGNVAMDAARVALRQGAKEVSVLYRRSMEEMPANPWEIQEAEKSDVKLEFLVAPKKILGKNARVVALECIRMQLGEPDETGRRRPVPIEGSEFTIELDTVITAIGEVPDLSLLPKGVNVTEANTVAVDPNTLETSLRGVFAGGDAVLGPATVIEAIVTGKRAAASIDRYLRAEHGIERRQRGIS